MNPLSLLNKLPIRVFLYTVVILITLSAAITLYSKKANLEAIKQNRIADRLLFEAKLPHDFSIRDADIALRGYALTNDAKFLFATIPRIRIEMETSFHRLDSILELQGHNSKPGRAKIERYKKEIRAFNDHQMELVQLINQGRMEEFQQQFESDAGSNLWAAFVDAVEEVNQFELALIKRSEFYAEFSSILAFWLQVITFVLSAPLLFYIVIRLDREKVQDKIHEEFRVKTELNILKEKMLSVLSHEIRTPLNSIIGLSRVLASKATKADQNEIVTTIRRSSDHLLHLVNDILDFNKINADKLVLEFIPFNIREIIKQVVNMYYGIASDKDILLTYKVEDAVPSTVVADPTRLTQILSNLVSNSIKFSTNGEIRILVNSKFPRNGDQVTITFEVQDDGIGIDENRISTIFEPFSQVHPISPSSEGTGLGLSIVKSLVQFMGGNIYVKSQLGVGSIFTIDLPVTLLDGAKEKLEDDSREENIAGMEILYIEDVASNRFLVETLLNDQGVKCITASSGLEATKIISLQKFDIILLDIKLPDIDGLELLALIKNDHMSQNRKTPVIIFSAYTELEGYRIESVGADDFLCKPFDPDTLISKIFKHSTRYQL